MGTPNLRGLTLRLAISTVIGLGAVAAQADTVVYDAIPAPVPGNVSSLGPEAYSGKELGDKITLAAGPRVLKKVDVLLSTWGCETGGWNTSNCVTTPGLTFTHPITLNIYQADGVTSVGSVTQTLTIPYRPSWDTVNCTGGNAGKWYDGTTCFNGKAVVVTFDDAALSTITLPDTFVFAVVYNTTHHGITPIGALPPEFQASVPYDSLNVGLPSAGPSIGTDETGIDGVYWHTTHLPFYCDGGLGGSSFRLDYAFECWGATVGVRFVTVPPAIEVNLSGFNSPVDPVPTLNKAKAGQAIPLKFYVATNPGGVPVTDLASVDVIRATVPCNDLDAVGVDPLEQYASGSSGLINQGGGYYQFNWKTVKGDTGCRVVTLALPDAYSSTPESLEAYFNFFK